MVINDIPMEAMSHLKRWFTSWKWVDFLYSDLLIGGDWNHGILWLSMQLGILSSQLTNSYLFRGIETNNQKKLWLSPWHTCSAHICTLFSTHRYPKPHKSWYILYHTWSIWKWFGAKQFWLSHQSTNHLGSLCSISPG